MCSYHRSGTAAWCSCAITQILVSQVSTLPSLSPRKMVSLINHHTRGTFHIIKIPLSFRQINGFVYSSQKHSLKLFGVPCTTTIVHDHSYVPIKITINSVVIAVSGPDTYGLTRRGNRTCGRQLTTKDCLCHGTESRATRGDMAHTSTSNSHYWNYQ